MILSPALEKFENILDDIFRVPISISTALFIVVRK